MTLYTIPDTDISVGAAEMQCDVLIKGPLICFSSIYWQQKLQKMLLFFLFIGFLNLAPEHNLL